MQKCNTRREFFLTGFGALHAQTARPARSTSTVTNTSPWRIWNATASRPASPGAGHPRIRLRQQPLSRCRTTTSALSAKATGRAKHVFHDDDAHGECFRAYRSVEASYQDHAEFLDSQPRYDSLFVYPADDYHSWARGLKAAGYATAPDYAQRLCRIIEEAQLFLLDQPDGERLYASRSGRKITDPEGWFTDQTSMERPADASSAVDPDNYRVTINAHNGYNVYATNGVHYVLAKEGDTFENIGKKFRISARNLRKFNDLKDKKAQPMPHEVVYIERKKKRWEGNAHTHTCRQGETADAVGQSYAIRTRSIEKLNKLRPGDTLEQGRPIRIK